MPITSTLGRLPVVWAGDTGTIPFRYRSGCCNGSHRYNHDLASADSSRGAGDGCPMYFVNSWALGWSRDSWSAMKCSVWSWLHIIFIYYTLYCIITFIIITYYYCLHQNIIITHYCISYYYRNITYDYKKNCYVLLHHYFIIITPLLQHYYNIITSLLLLLLLHYYYIIIMYYYNCINTCNYIIITTLLH